MRSLVLLTFALLAGCSAPAEDAPLDAAPEPLPVEDPWAGEDRILIQEMGGGSGVVTMLDVLCQLGGPPVYERDVNRVLAGTSHLEFAVSVEGAMTPFQVGYALSDSGRGGTPSDFTWLDPVSTGETAVFEVPVAPDQVEEPAGEPRWYFSYRNNPGREDLCYTGGGSGSFAVLVEAVRAGAAAPS